MRIQYGSIKESQSIMAVDMFVLCQPWQIQSKGIPLSYSFTTTYGWYVCRVNMYRLYNLISLLNQAATWGGWGGWKELIFVAFGVIFGKLSLGFTSFCVFLRPKSHTKQSPTLYRTGAVLARRAFFINNGWSCFCRFIFPLVFISSCVGWCACDSTRLYPVLKLVLIEGFGCPWL